MPERLNRLICPRYVPGATAYWAIDGSYRTGIAPSIGLAYDTKAVMSL
jgi:hypothetical protein